MSLILTWENPQQTYDAACHAVQIWRGPSGSGTLIEGDSTWGVFEDPTENDIDADLNVAYIGQDGGIIFEIVNAELRKFLRPSNLCKVVFNLTSPDGGPDDGRLIEVTGASGFCRRFLTNRKGKAIFFGVRGYRFTIKLDNSLRALDCVLPDVNEVLWPALAPFGSWINADNRSRI